MSKAFFKSGLLGHLLRDYSEIYLIQLSMISHLLSHKSYPKGKKNEKWVSSLVPRIIEWFWLPGLRRILKLRLGSLSIGSRKSSK